MLKLSENPPGVFPEVESLFGVAGTWWVAHTKARAEKALAWDLGERGISYFLPMVNHVIFSGGRKRHGLLALFPSYVFFCGDENTRYRAFTTGRVSQVIAVKEQAELVTELEQLHVAIRKSGALTLAPRLVVGERCKVRGGPFEGLRGTVVRNEGRACVVLRVSLLGQGAMLEIEPEFLEADETESCVVPSRRAMVAV